jgi:hypothetical protein
MNTIPSEAGAAPATFASRLKASVPARLKAAGIHVALSLVVFLVALYLILVEWYPGFHFTVDGGWQGVRIMAAVDLILGPTLTLIIFNPFKSRRAIGFDLACIGIAQLAALVWGFYAIHSQYPVAVSYVDGKFRSLTVEPLRIEKYDPAQLSGFSDHHPPLVYVRPAANDDEETRKQMQEFVGGLAEHEDPFFFEPFAKHWTDVRAKGRSLEKQRKVAGKSGSAALEAFVAQHPGAEGWLYYDYTGRYGMCTVAFTPDGALVDAFSCDPL